MFSIFFKFKFLCRKLGLLWYPTDYKTISFYHPKNQAFYHSKNQALQLLHNYEKRDEIVVIVIGGCLSKVWAPLLFKFKRDSRVIQILFLD